MHRFVNKTDTSSISILSACISGIFYKQCFYNVRSKPRLICVTHFITHPRVSHLEISNCAMPNCLVVMILSCFHTLLLLLMTLTVFEFDYIYGTLTDFDFIYRTSHALYLPQRQIHMFYICHEDRFTFFVSATNTDSHVLYLLQRQIHNLPQIQARMF